jgi:hypothetical protein
MAGPTLGALALALAGAAAGMALERVPPVGPSAPSGRGVPSRQLQASASGQNQIFDSMGFRGEA